MTVPMTMDAISRNADNDEPIEGIASIANADRAR